MKLCNVNISCCTRRQLFSSLDAFIHIVTVNAEAIAVSQENERLRMIINNAYSTIDGQVPLWLYKIRYREVPIEKISGSDLIYDVCKWAKSNGDRIFLLGGSKDANMLAVSNLSEKFNVYIDGFSPDYEAYPFSSFNNEMIISKINEFAPQILFVGFGMGKQEFWIDDNKEVLKALGVRMVVGCGGTFDFASGRISRAPKFIQNIGLEGIWRLFKEPKLFRFKRVFISLKIFYYFFR